MAPPLAPTRAATSHPTTTSKVFLYPMLPCGHDVCLALVQTLGWIMRYCCQNRLLVTWLLLLNHCVQQTTNTPSSISWISTNRHNDTLDLDARRRQLWDPGIVVRVVRVRERGCALLCPTQAVAYTPSLPSSNPGPLRQESGITAQTTALAVSSSVVIESTSQKAVASNCLCRVIESLIPSPVASELWIVHKRTAKSLVASPIEPLYPISASCFGKRRVRVANAVHPVFTAEGVQHLQAYERTTVTLPVNTSSTTPVLNSIAKHPVKSCVVVELLTIVALIPSYNHTVDFIPSLTVASLNPNSILYKALVESVNFTAKTPTFKCCQAIKSLNTSTTNIFNRVKPKLPTAELLNCRVDESLIFAKTFECQDLSLITAESSTKTLKPSTSSCSCVICCRCQAVKSLNPILVPSPLLWRIILRACGNKSISP